MKVSKTFEKENSLYSKLSEKEREIFRKAKELVLPEKKVLTYSDLIQFETAKEILIPIKEKYKVSLEELFALMHEELFFPAEIVNKKLTILEAVVKYLKEEEELSLSEISKNIKRDERNVWHIYDNARKKHSEKFVVKEVKFWIPIGIFSEKLSALESIVFYLKEKFSLTYHEIAILLKRDDRTIWTVYQRAKKKC